MKLFKLKTFQFFLSLLILTVMTFPANANDFSALGRSQSAGRIIHSVSDTAYLNKSGKTITEKAISALSSADYGKTGLIADGNSRLILRYRSSQPGTVTFSLSPSIPGAKLESLTGRQNITSALSTVNTSNDYQVSAVLIAPEAWPTGISYPKGNFTVTATFAPSNGGAAESSTLNLTLQAAPVVLIHGVFGDNETMFGYNSGKNAGVWYKLEQAGLTVASWNHDKHKSPKAVIANNSNGLAKVIESTLNALNSQGFEATRVDLVTHSSGGLMARQYLRNDINTGNKTANSYGLGTVRRVVTIASPNLGTPIASYLAGNFDTLPASWQNWPAKTWWEGTAYPLMRAFSVIHDDAVPTMEDLSLGSSYLASLGYPGVPFHSIYGKVMSDNEKINQLFDDVINQNIVSLKKIDWLPPQLVDNLISSKLALISGILSAVSDDIRFKELFGALFASDDHDLVVSETSAKDIFPSAAVTSFEGLGAHNHVMIARQDDVGDKVISLLRGGTENFMINTASAALYDKAFDSYVSSFSNTFRASASGDLSEYIDGSLLIVMSDVETEYMGGDESSKPTVGSAKLSGNSATLFSNDICVIVRDNDNDIAKFFVINVSNDTTSFDFNLWADRENKGIFEICFMAEQDGKLKISEPSKVVFPPLLYDDVTAITFSNGGNIYGNTGDEVSIGLTAHTKDGNYDISAPDYGLAQIVVSDPSVAEVTSSGKIKFLKNGSTAITATAYGHTVSTDVLVVASAEEADTVQDLEITDESSSESESGSNSNSVQNYQAGPGTSGGCSAGFAGIALMLMLLPAFVRKSER